MSLKNPKSSVPLCSSSRPTCLSTNHSASLLIYVPTPVVKPSLNVCSITGKSYPVTQANPPANLTKLSKTPVNVRVLRKVYPIFPNTSTNCKPLSLCHIVNLQIFTRHFQAATFDLSDLGIIFTVRFSYILKPTNSIEAATITTSTTTII
ncbi:hypothetical protein DOY81_004011 [Sarcophaga bullata]|nr:hypothetical protein DOY81_004011 [Sarcophaga bullata]